jgi:hypothetical protein
VSEAVKAFKRLFPSKSIGFKINVSKKKHVKKRKVVLPRKPLNVELLGIEDVGTSIQVENLL